MDNPNETQKRTLSTGSKIAILVILIVLLAIGILLPIKIVPRAVSDLANSISSFFFGKKTITVTASPSEINTGDTFKLSWTGDHKTNGTYTLSYECATGVHLETSVNQPNETIACGSSYYFTPNDNSVDIAGFSEANRYTDVTIGLGFLENGATTIDNLGTTTVTITNPNIAGTDTSGGTTTPNTTKPGTTTPPSTTREPSEGTKGTKPSVKPTPTPSHAVSNPNGIADLEVRPIAVGFITRTGAFVPSASVPVNQQAAIKFQIVNVGDKNTGVWGFSADLPSDTDPRFVSGPQQNLGPGDRIEYVLGFKNLKNVPSNTAVIYADPSNFIQEASKVNNVARMVINNGLGYGQPDLVVRVLDTGVINKSTGAYVKTGSVYANDRAAIRFEVQNIGTGAANSWKFRAILPTLDLNNINYISDVQPPLLPGQKYIYTVGFENVRFLGNNTISIHVDSDNVVTELNENNNFVNGNINRY